MGLSIYGIGTALPPHRVAQPEAARLAGEICGRNLDDHELIKVLYRQTGIKTRHMVVPPSLAYELVNSEVDDPGSSPRFGPGTEARMLLFAEHAAPLAERATRAALDQSQFSAGEITHLVTVSCTGMSAPGLDFELIERLKLSPSVQRTNVGFMGCHGAVNGLRVAQAFADADPNSKILVSATELCSIHFYFGWDPKKIVANALFADGSAAVVGIGSRGVRRRDPLEAETPANSRPRWNISASGSCLLPSSHNAMSWNIGDDGFAMSLSSKVPQLILDHLGDWMERWLMQHSLKLDEVGSWAVHPGGPRILTAVQEALGLDNAAIDTSRELLVACGNMSSPTILFILERLLADNARLPCVALGFGPGLVAEALLIR